MGVIFSGGIFIEGNFLWGKFLWGNFHNCPDTNTYKYIETSMGNFNSDLIMRARKRKIQIEQECDEFYEIYK